MLDGKHEGEVIDFAFEGGAAQTPSRRPNRWLYLALSPVLVNMRMAERMAESWLSNLSRGFGGWRRLFGRDLPCRDQWLEHSA